MSQHYENAVHFAASLSDAAEVAKVEATLYVGEQLENLAGVFGTAQGEAATPALPKELRDELLGLSTPRLTEE